MLYPQDMDAAFLQARIDSCEALIVAIEAALLTLGSSEVHSTTLNTGQTIQTVTKKDIKDLNDMLNSAINRLAGLENRRNGSGVVNVRPAW